MNCIYQNDSLCVSILTANSVCSLCVLLMMSRSCCRVSGRPADNRYSLAAASLGVTTATLRGSTAPRADMSNTRETLEPRLQTRRVTEHHFSFLTICEHLYNRRLTNQTAFSPGRSHSHCYTCKKISTFYSINTVFVSFPEQTWRHFLISVSFKGGLI